MERVCKNNFARRRGADTPVCGAETHLGAPVSLMPLSKRVEKSLTWDSALVVGRTPLGGALWATGRPRSSLEESSPSTTQQAGQGAGRGRGRPPHYLCRCAFVGKPCGIGLPSAVVFTAETQRCRGRYSKATRVTSALSEPFLAFLSASLRLCGEKELESSL